MYGTRKSTLASSVTQSLGEKYQKRYWPYVTTLAITSFAMTNMYVTQFATKFYKLFVVTPPQSLKSLVTLLSAVKTISSWIRYTHAPNLEENQFSTRQRNQTNISFNNYNDRQLPGMKKKALSQQHFFITTNLNDLLKPVIKIFPLKSLQWNVIK